MGSQSSRSSGRSRRWKKTPLELPPRMKTAGKRACGSGITLTPSLLQHGGLLSPDELGVDLDVAHEPVFLGMIRLNDLEHLAVADRHQRVEVRDVVQRVAAMVDLVAHAERLGEVRRLDH